MKIIGRPARDALLLAQTLEDLDDQEHDHCQPGGYPGSGRQLLLAMALGPIDAGGAALGDQGGVEFGR